MDDRNQDRQDYQHNRPHRGGRPRHRGGNEHRHSGGGSGGRSQRPLLTSAITAGGLSLIALLLTDANPSLARENLLLTICVLVYGLSAIVSYVAQRVRAVWVEKISDYLFLAATAIIISIAVSRLGLF